MQSSCGLNQASLQKFQLAQSHAAALNIQAKTLPCGAQILDFGVATHGGLQAGIRLAEICMAGKAEIGIGSGDRQVWVGPWVQVCTDAPVEACILSQYAGWPVSKDRFFAMGSGSMRVRRGREQVLIDLMATDADALAVGTLECDRLPDCSIANMIAEECKVSPDQVYLAVAPTRSIAGCVQVVARSVETAMHKLHELGVDLHCIHSAHGVAPLPPPTPDFALGIGRTNDAILYGASVTMWVDCDDGLIERVGAQLPSCASTDFGSPFVEIFRRYNSDFYKVDPGLFSPAEVTLMSLKSGKSWRFGGVRPDIVAQSFGVQ